METGPLNATPLLSLLGLAVMDELCARRITSPKGENNVENERNGHLQAGVQPSAPKD